MYGLGIITIGMKAVFLGLHTAGRDSSSMVVRVKQLVGAGIHTILFELIHTFFSFSKHCKDLVSDWTHMYILSSC